jgi:hypothetical protein
MDDDDLPPQPRDDDTGFSGELGRTFAGFIWVAAFLAVAGGVLFGLTRLFGH